MQKKERSSPENVEIVRHFEHSASIIHPDPVDPFEKISIIRHKTLH